MKKILIVDDDALGVEILKKRLEVNNYETIFVSNSKEALEKVKTERPNLILLDLILPDEDGSEVCKILKTDSQTKSIPLLIRKYSANHVIICSGGVARLVSHCKQCYSTVVAKLALLFFDEQARPLHL